jgi:broad specificity phosphatase PhoE
MSHTITFLRHGLSVANENGIVQGQMDYPLSEQGIAQANALAAYWSDHHFEFDLLISSPLVRASSTAEIISRALRIPVEYDESWMERLSGTAQGKAYEALDTLAASSMQPSSHDPLFEHGESEWDLFLRAAAAIQKLVRRPSGSYLVVSHGAILAAAFRAIFGVSPPSGRTRPLRIRFENTGYSIFEYHSGDARWSLRKHNVTTHLDLSPRADRQVDE